MKKIFKRKNLFIAVMLLCLGIFTSCSLDFAEVKSIEFSKAPEATYVLYKNDSDLVPLSQFEVTIEFDGGKTEKRTCDDKLLTINGDTYIVSDKIYLDTRSIGLKKITIKYENVSIMVTFEVVDTTRKVYSLDELQKVINEEKCYLIEVYSKDLNGQNVDYTERTLNIDRPVHIIGVDSPEFKHIIINTDGQKGIFELEGIDIVNKIEQYDKDNNVELLNIIDDNPFAKVIVNKCNFKLEKAFKKEGSEIELDEEKINSNAGEGLYDFIRINKDTGTSKTYFNIEITNNTFETINKTAVFSAINIPVGENTYSSLFIYNNTFNIAARYVLTKAWLSNLEILDNIVTVHSSTENGKITEATGLQFGIYKDSLSNIKGNEFNMDECGEKSYALNITFALGSENAIQKFIANLSTNKLSSKTCVNILSWIHNLKTIDFGQQNLTESQFSISKEGKEIVLINEGYDPSREYFKIENGKYVKVEVLNEKQFLSKKETGEITHLRKNTNISWNIRFIDTNGNEQFIDPFPGDEDIYKAN